jgi:tetratricopeptide (TPR) repeat protein
MDRLFVSHSSKDDAFVRELRWTLADLKQEVWIDSRELRAGDPLWPEIQKAIEQSSSVAVVVSPSSLQAKWVGKELRHALAVQERRGREAFPVFALSLDGTKLGVLESLFDEEPLYIPVSSAAGGVEAAMNPILVAMGKRLPAEVAVPPQPTAEPLEELVLELTDLKFHEDNGVRRPSARARLVYVPSTPGQREVASAQSWRLIAPIGPIEAGELRWYLEKYAVWPSHYFQARARKVEEALVQWGRLLHDAALPAAYTASVINAWARISDNAGRRFSVHVDAALEAGSPAGDAAAVREVATLLLGLPWELLHDGDGYLFQGAKPIRVRRRLPNTRALDVSVVAAPIRVLLVTARPEDEACAYIDHRVNALPLVEAMERLGGLVRLHVLSPPTFDALGEELQRAFDAREPYHVVHFDGHGVYDKRVGLGALCFEDPSDTHKLYHRRHVTVHTDKLGPLLKDHRIPLVFLEACQTAQAEDASESVASELLQRGVASVVAMSHSVLVETARRFVEAFYAGLAHGRRVGDAMLEGQNVLKNNTFRGRVFGAGELRLEDWFVPVLFQEKEDPQLFRSTPAPQTQEDLRTILSSRLGALPAEPETGFVGRSRELLALQRLLRHERYAVVRGQGGEGKTALAEEFARWMVRSQQVRRAAFVSVEAHGHGLAVLDAVGSQLVGGRYSAAAFSNVEKAILPIERALREQSTLLVVDNMESIFPPPYVETPEALSEEAGRELMAILNLCERLVKVGDTRLVFTSREALPAPFDHKDHRLELPHLHHEDAVRLVERVLNAAGGDGGGASDAAQEEIEALVGAVSCHVRTLTLLAPELQTRGVEATRKSLVELMAEMDRQIAHLPANDPRRREMSLFASVELSLRRLSPASRDKARVLAVFHGGVDLDALRHMMQWEVADVGALASELIVTGLATPKRFNHLRLDPALCPYLRGRMDAVEIEALTARWVEAMRAHTRFLDGQMYQNAELAATLTVLEQPNLFSLLDLVQHAGDAEATIDLTTRLYRLFSLLGKPRLLKRFSQMCYAAARDLEGTLGDAGNHALFEAARTHVEHQLATRRLREAFDGAQQLLQRARTAGEQAYPGADYDLAGACILMARVLKSVGGSEQVLPLLDEARQRFQAVATKRSNEGAERMASVCFAERADILLGLGRLGEAAAIYEEAMLVDEQRGDARLVAVGIGQLGVVRMWQGRYPEALEAAAEARERFAQFGELTRVASSWNLTGIVHQEAGQLEAAEDAYRKALAIEVRLGNAAAQAKTLTMLGLLYDDALSRSEDAVAFLQQAVELCVDVGNVAGEGRNRSNLAICLHKLRRLDEARQEVRRAIECGTQFGHESEPWKTWALLADIETDAGNPAAAAVARGEAIGCFLAFRLDGGENRLAPGRISLAVTQFLLAGDPAQAASLLEQQLPSFEAAGFSGFIRALQAIVAGRRDRSLADAPDLHPTMAAEILFLIETLEKPR